MKISQWIMLAGSVSGALAVMIGAFGAHALKAILEQNERVGTFDTASKYHFYHSLLLLVIGLIQWNTPGTLLTWSAWLVSGGIIFFSGSLYTLSLTNYKLLGAVAPVGGLLLIAGWLLLFWHYFKQ